MIKTRLIGSNSFLIFPVALPLSDVIVKLQYDLYVYVDVRFRDISLQEPNGGSIPNQVTLLLPCSQVTN